MNKEKLERLKKLKKKSKKKKGTDSVSEQMKKVNELSKEEVPTLPKKLEMRDELIAQRIYSRLVEMVNEALEKKGVRISHKAKFKTIYYKDKDWIKQVHKMGDENWIYVFPHVDTNDGHKKIGMVFQKIVYKEIKTK